MNAPINVSQTIELRAVTELLPYAKNARTHSDEQVQQIAASMREFGFTNPVLIDGAGEIIAGHGRCMAAAVLGLTEVPTITLGYLTPEQKRAYILADNKLAMNAGWDFELLAEELAAIELDGFDLELTGFTDTELKSLLGDDKPKEQTGDKKSNEVNMDDFKFEHVCPRCSFEFNGNK